ncbi:MAG: Fur family transcriptional regulator [Acidimicrobiia bacterium]
MKQHDRDLRARLRACGLRVTTPRLVVIGWLAGHPHSTAAEISQQLADDGFDLSRQGIYDVLAVCTKAGLLRKIEPADSPARYETRTGDNHHHLVCRICGRTEDVDCAVGVAPCLTPSSIAGYTVDEAEVVYWGLCLACTDSARKRE